MKFLKPFQNKNKSSCFVKFLSNDRLGWEKQSGVCPTQRQAKRMGIPSNI